MGLALFSRHYFYISASQGTLWAALLYFDLVNSCAHPPPRVCSGPRPSSGSESLDLDNRQDSKRRRSDIRLTQEHGLTPVPSSSSAPEWLRYPLYKQKWTWSLDDFNETVCLLRSTAQASSVVSKTAGQVSEALSQWNSAAFVWSQMNNIINSTQIRL